jgi:hypothetical protein
VVNKLQPVDRAVLYEGMNVSDHADLVMKWVDRHLESLAAGLAKTPDRAGALFGATPVRRGYYGKRNSPAMPSAIAISPAVSRKAIEAKIPTSGARTPRTTSASSMSSALARRGRARAGPQRSRLEREHRVGRRHPARPARPQERSGAFGLMRALPRRAQCLGRRRGQGERQGKAKL